MNFLKLVPPAFLGLFAAAAACGADSGFYLGADLGRSDYPSDAKLIVDLTASTLASGHLSNHDLGWGLPGATDSIATLPLKQAMSTSARYPVRWRTSRAQAPRADISTSQFGAPLKRWSVSFLSVIGKAI